MKRSMKFKEICQYDLLKENITSVKESSFDDSNKCSLVDDHRLVVDFDRVKQNLTAKMHKSEDGTKSVDALSSNGDKTLFIEFKNESINNSGKLKIRIKAIDSILIWSEITRKKWYEFRDDIEFILVYSKEKNKNKVRKEFEKSQNEIHDHFMNLAGKEMVYFEMSELANYHFTAVHTYNEDEFIQYMDDCLDRDCT